MNFIKFVVYAVILIPVGLMMLAFGALAWVFFLLAKNCEMLNKFLERYPWQK